MKKDTARKLYNRLNNTLQETLEILAMLENVICEVDNTQDYDITQNELIAFNNKKQDLIIEMSKLQKNL